MKLYIIHLLFMLIGLNGIIEQDHSYSDLIGEWKRPVHLRTDSLYVVKTMTFKKDMTYIDSSVYYKTESLDSIYFFNDMHGMLKFNFNKIEFIRNYSLGSNGIRLRYFSVRNPIRDKRPFSIVKNRLFLKRTVLRSYPEKHLIITDVYEKVE